MRSRCSSSGAAVLVVAALAGCGGARVARTVPLPAFPDPRGPLDFHVKAAVQRSGVRLEAVTFRAGTRLVPAYLVFPVHRAGRLPGVVFVHGSGGTMGDFVVSATRFALAGGVGLSIQQPNDATSWAPLVDNVRRALDLLASRPDVDAKRLGVAGLSLGAQTAAIVAGVDPRPKVFALMSCRGRRIVLRSLSLARGDRFFVQDGRFDEVVPRPQLLRTISALKALHEPLAITWYPTGHVLDPQAFVRQVGWLRAELHVGSG